MPRFVLVAGIGLAVALAGCAAQPSYPLMTPIQVAQSFGYDDHQIGPERYEVSYVTPTREAYGYRFDTSPTERVAKDMAFDLASLRAAQLAQQAGFEGFDITDQHSSSDAEFTGPYWDGPGYWGGGWAGYGGWGWRRRYGWGGYYGFEDGWYQAPRDRIQAEVKLTVTMVHAVKPGEYRAGDVVSQVSTRYPGALTAPPTGLPPTAQQPAAAPVAPPGPASHPSI